ncbi:MAG: DUF4105 domain-containing protein [Acidobacteriota bacterium]
MSFSRLPSWFMLSIAVSLFTPLQRLWAQDPRADQAAYLNQLQQQARTLNLAGQDAWRALLHYKVHPLTRQDRSLADDPDFFNAPDGARHPQAELDATLAAFFDSAPKRALDQTASCRFVARYQWLNESLHFDPARLPPPTCERYQQWRAGLNAASATLVFPAAYLNSPASMYGHTFLRLDPPATGGARSPLLSYAINYAANGNEAEGLAFAIKGLLGLYPGQFTNSPYYLRIRDYNDLENRDIWEYDLNLSPQEMDRLLAHAWELGPTRFDYFFFDENCSYHLLALLDAARPGLHLTDSFTWWAIPIDTVRVVTDHPGFLKATHYRASNSTELRYRSELLGPKRAALAKQLALSQIEPAVVEQAEFNPAIRARMYEVAERYLAYEATQRAMGHEQVQQQRMRLLSARAALPSGPAIETPTPGTPPQAGHGTARVDMLVGQRNGASVLQIQARPAYHDLLDPEAGFQRGSAIQFGRIELSKAENGSLQLERFIPVEIESLSPYDGLLSARSWRVRFGLTRTWPTLSSPSLAHRKLAAEVNGGPGLAAELGSSRNLLGYVFLDNQLWLDPAMPKQKFAAGSGLATGLLWDLTGRWRVQAEVYARASLDHQPQESGARLDQRYQWSHQLNLVAQCQWKRRQNQAMQHECLAGVQTYW